MWYIVRGDSVEVYPRVCGGTPPDAGIAPVVKGLSPRVRGNLGNAVAHLACRGSIPACAGEPRLVGRPSHALWVYPRVCGGTGSIVRGERGAIGLSPRVRGNPFRRGLRMV